MYGVQHPPNYIEHSNIEYPVPNQLADNDVSRTDSGFHHYYSVRTIAPQYTASGQETLLGNRDIHPTWDMNVDATAKISLRL